MLTRLSWLRSLSFFDFGKAIDSAFDERNIRLTAAIDGQPPDD